MLLGEDAALSRKATIYFCHRYSGARLREIGERFGLSDAAVAQASRRLRVAAEHDEELRGALKRVAEKLRLYPVEA